MAVRQASLRNRALVHPRASTGAPPSPSPAQPPRSPPPAPAARLRAALASARSSRQCLIVPACYDALGAKLIARDGGFKAAFCSGFGLSASRLGQPDAGVISYAEMEEAGRHCCAAASDVDPGFPIIGDGDTGFGGVQNIWRAVSGYAAAGFAAISIEDQTFPKRCAFSRGMRCVPRDEAVVRVRQALAAAKHCYETTGREILVVGRTDVRNDDSYSDAFAEALWRAQAFEELGCDIVYFEGPQTVGEMTRFNRKIMRAYTMLAQVEKPGRPLLTQQQAASVGYTTCLHGLTLLSAALKAQEQALAALRTGVPPSPPLPPEEEAELRAAIEAENAAAVAAASAAAAIAAAEGAGTGAGAGAGAGVQSPGEGQGGLQMPPPSLLSDFEHLYSVVGFDKLSELEQRFK